MVTADEKLMSSRRFGVHIALVTDVHAVVTHVTAPMLLVMLTSNMPKPSPSTVSVVWPEPRTFGMKKAELRAASNVKAASWVPIDCPTVTYESGATEDAALDWQATEVDDDHEEEEQIAAAGLTVVVKSLVPKFRPLTVIDAPPVRGVLNAKFDPKGASKLKPGICVPTTNETVD
jgi:hypothetical protein